MLGLAKFRREWSKDAGATLVEIGHSERRAHFAESDETIALKVRAALSHGLLALVCVGDTRQEYDAGKTSTALAKQVRAALTVVEAHERDRVVIAYEPVWSIGEGGIPADPEFADRQHALIKEQSLRVFAEPHRCCLRRQRQSGKLLRTRTQETC